MARHVLVMNDDPPIRAMLREALLSEGYSVSVVNDGPEALQLLSATRTHYVILVDALMPVMSGPDLLRQLARDSHTLRQHVYICMGWRIWPIEQVRKDLGLSEDFWLPQISYPFDLDYLIGLVREAAHRLERLWPRQCPHCAPARRRAITLHARLDGHCLRGWYAPCRRSAAQRRRRAP